MAVLYDEEGHIVNSGKKLDAIPAFNTFYVSTSNNSTNATDPSSHDKGDDIDTNTVHLNDFELSSFFKDSGDGGEELQL